MWGVIPAAGQGVGTDSVGGAEQIIVHLDKALVEAGHKSLVITPAGSRTQGELIETPPAQDEITAELRRTTYVRRRQIVSRTTRQFDPDLLFASGYPGRASYRNDSITNPPRIRLKDQTRSALNQDLRRMATPRMS
jgi:hypothetical protein